MVSQDKTELDSKSTEESSISDKTKACEEGSKAEEELQKTVPYEYFPAAYDFVVPKEPAKVNYELKEKTKASEESSKAKEEPQKPVPYDFSVPKEYAKVNSKLKEEITAPEKSSKTKEEPRKSVAYECFPAAYDFFVLKESAKVNCELKEETKAFEESSKVEKEPQKYVAYENCEPEGFVKVNYKLIAKTKASVAYEFFEPKESNSNKTLLYYKNNSKLKPKSKAYEESLKAEEEPQNHMAYEFIEPKVSAPINSKLKANLRAKFEMNQINRGRIPQN